MCDLQCLICVFVLIVIAARDVYIGPKYRQGTGLDQPGLSVHISELRSQFDSQPNLCRAIRHFFVCMYVVLIDV